VLFRSKHPTVEADIRHAAEYIMTRFTQKPAWLFLCHDNSLTSQMAAAFAQRMAGDTIDMYSAGFNPAQDIHPLLVPAMEEKGIDLAYRKPCDIESASRMIRPERVIVIGETPQPLPFPCDDIMNWDMGIPRPSTMEEIKKMRDRIEDKVNSLLSTK
jgi:arsenate reductase